MQVINWLELQPLPADLETLRARLRQALPLRTVCQSLVETTLRAYPWAGRADLISCYHPAQTYERGERLALCISNPRNVRRTVWLLGQVKNIKSGENSLQGCFQVLTLEIQGRQIEMAAGIAGASYPEPDLSHYALGDFTWLVKWISANYATALQATVKTLIQKGQLPGRLAGETFLPEQVSALSPELLHPIFARLSADRPWISLEEIFRGLPDLAPLERPTTLRLLRATLQESPYRSLGGDRWTSPDLFKQLNRDMPPGSSSASTTSKAPLRMKRAEPDLAGFEGKFMPAEAREMLEELGLGDVPSARELSPWHPPKEPVPLPALNYLHITQACFPVRSVLYAFAPDVQMIFIQFINGDHQPFLLDRENGLLKAVHPEQVRDKILEHGIPAGTSLWLEHQGNESYRVAPRLLPFKRMVPCKLAYLEQGQLHIAHTHVSMKYEGNPFLFRSELRFKEIEARFAEASRMNRKLRETMIYVLQEVCATDPDHRAHRSDLFNAVLLEQMCSPRSVVALLYTQPCFEPIGNGYFRYRPVQQAVRKTHKRKDRLSLLWDHLLTDFVAPHPAAKIRTAVRSQKGQHAFPPFDADLELPSIQSGPEVAEAVPAYGLAEESTATEIALQEDQHTETFLLSDHEPDGFTPTEVEEPESTPWRESLEKLLHSLVELEDPESSSLSTEEGNSDISIEAAHEETLGLSSPFRWEPKPAWITPPVQTKTLSPRAVDANRLVYRSKVPLRPLHKQRFYRRFFFYLRSWLSRSFGKAT